MNQQALIFPDEADAIAYWEGREWKKWAVRFTAGPARRPTIRQTYFARARTPTAAIQAVQRGLIAKPPRGALFSARLAGPRELGCIPTPAPEDSWCDRLEAGRQH